MVEETQNEIHRIETESDEGAYPPFDDYAPHPADGMTKEQLNTALVFNLNALRAKDVKRFNSAIRTLDEPVLSVFFSRMVARAPANWGAANLPATYGNLSLLTYQRIYQLYNEAVADELKK